jgi:hypothetical protein
MVQKSMLAAFLSGILFVKIFWRPTGYREIPMLTNASV